MKDLTWIQNELIAHRGFHSKDGSVPENSIAAFKEAIQRGYGIEFDINVLGDGTVMCFHDINFKRLCGVDKNLADVDLKYAKTLHLLNTSEQIPTLKEVLDFVDGRVPLLIELKPLGDNDTLCREFMKVMNGYTGKWAMHSFHPKTVLWFKINHPEVIRGQVTEFFKDDPKMKNVTKFLMKTMAFNLFTKPDFINYGVVDMPNKYLDRVFKKGVTVIGYASQNQEQFDMVKEHYHNSVFEYFEPKK